MGNGDRLLSNENTKPGEKRLTRSSSRSMAESAAFMIEPLSDSMEEDIIPAARRSVGLTGKRGEKGRQEREANGECTGRTLGVDRGMRRGGNYSLPKEPGRREMVNTLTSSFIRKVQGPGCKALWRIHMVMINAIPTGRVELVCHITGGRWWGRWSTVMKRAVM